MAHREYAVTGDAAAVLEEEMAIQAEADVILADNDAELVRLLSLTPDQYCEAVEE